MSRRFSDSRTKPNCRHPQAKRQYTRSAASLLAVLTAPALIGGAPAPASAAEWTFVPSIGVRQSFTDNARQQPRGSESFDTFTTVTPGISVMAEGARLNMALDYSVGLRHYYDNSDLDDVRHNLLGGGTMTVVPDLLFFDARASISQQIVNPTGQQSAGFNNENANDTSGNSQTVRTYSLSPYLVNRFGGFAQSELRYTFNQTDVGGGVGTTTTNAISETLMSGDDFTRLRWVTQLQASQSKASNVDPNVPTTAFTGPAHDSAHYLALFSPEYAVNRYLILLSAIGYEKFDDDTLREEPNGWIGNAGVRVNPGPRSTFRVLANHRYDQNYFTGDASYLIGPTTRIDAAYTRDIQTVQSLYAENLSYLGTDQYGNFIDARTLQTFRLDNSAFGSSGSAFLQERYSLRLTTEQYRDSYTVELFRESRESGVEVAKQTSTGFNISWSRPLNYLTNFSAALQYRDSEYTDSMVNGQPRQDQTWRGGPALTYFFNETLTGTLNYDFLYRTSNAANGDLQENIISVGVRKIF